jgi:hypothetical protein
LAAQARSADAGGCVRLAVVAQKMPMKGRLRLLRHGGNQGTTAVPVEIRRAGASGD